MRISHRVYVMGHGRIVFEGTRRTQDRPGGAPRVPRSLIACTDPNYSLGNPQFCVLTFVALIGGFLLLAEVDMLNEHDLAVIVFDDVVAVEPIAVLIEIVGALGARVALHAQDRLADLLRLKTLSVVDRER